MAAITIEPTAADKRIANAIASHTNVDLEKTSQLLTWVSDEKLLLTLAVDWEIGTYNSPLVKDLRQANERPRRRAKTPIASTFEVPARRERRVRPSG